MQVRLDAPAIAAAMEAMPSPAPTSHTRRPRTKSGCSSISRASAVAAGHGRLQYGSLSPRPGVLACIDQCITTDAMMLCTHA